MTTHKFLKNVSITIEQYPINDDTLELNYVFQTYVVLFDRYDSDNYSILSARCDLLHNIKSNKYVTEYDTFDNINDFINDCFIPELKRKIEYIVESEPCYEDQQIFITPTNKNIEHQIIYHEMYVSQTLCNTMPNDLYDLNDRCYIHLNPFLFQTEFEKIGTPENIIATYVLQLNKNARKKLNKIIKNK